MRFSTTGYKSQVDDLANSRERISSGRPPRNYGTGTFQMSWFPLRSESSAM
jgi:hypothetical protein